MPIFESNANFSTKRDKLKAAPRNTVSIKNLLINNNVGEGKAQLLLNFCLLQFIESVKDLAGLVCGLTVRLQVCTEQDDIP